MGCEDKRGAQGRACSIPLAGRLLAPLALVAALGAPACKTHHDQWTFAVTRNVYGDGGPGVHFEGHGSCAGGSGEAALAVLVLLLLPVAIDIVILPVTLTHDLCDR